tara:strand:+ start:3233 stop:3640 length:408 start_codon:yes stop_codon:yes gene_type:complete
MKKEADLNKEADLTGMADLSGMDETFLDWGQKIAAKWRKFWAWVGAFPGAALKFSVGWWGILFRAKFDEGLNGRAEICARWGSSTLVCIVSLSLIFWACNEFSYVVLWRGFIFSVVVSLCVALFVAGIVKKDGKT